MTMKRSPHMRRFLSLIAILCYLTIIPFSARAIVFTDEAAFQTAAGGVVMKTFEAYSLLDPVPTFTFPSRP